MPDQLRRSPEKVKLFLRLSADVNERLRSALRYRGDLSRLVESALSKSDLSRVELVRADAKWETRGTTASINSRTGLRLAQVAMLRRCSINLLANSAIAQWLARV